MPPRAVYLLKGALGTAAQKVKLMRHDMWMVEARSIEEGGELESESVAVVERAEWAVQAASDAWSANQRWAGRKRKRAAVDAGRDRGTKAVATPLGDGAAQGRPTSCRRSMCRHC